MNASSGARAPVDVVGRVAVVLREVAAFEPEGATTSEIARATSLARPTAHRILASLQAQGLLDRDREGRWMLGPELYLLGSAAASRYDITALAQPIVRQLAVVTGESAFLSVRRGDETVCLIREDGSFPVRSHVLHVGIRLPLGVASAGLAILAFLTQREVDDYLGRSDLTATYGDTHRADDVRARLHETHTLGYATNPGLLVEGSWGMGAAVFDAHERPGWALSLTGIEHRFSDDRRPELGALLMRAAHELGRLVASSPGA